MQMITKIPGVVLGVLTLLSMLGCQDNIIEPDGAPIQPAYLDVDVSFKQLPSDQGFAKIEFDITFVGDSLYEGDSRLISSDGDTASYLWLYFSTDWRTDLLKVDPDSIWHGKVAVGDNIRLGYDLQIADTTEVLAICCKSDMTACHIISLGARLYTEQMTRAKIDTTPLFVPTSASLYFNHRTENFIWLNPFDINNNNLGEN